ncbi:uncharacterized protein LOC128252503 [Drosophila gunungcola]|uniref:uncharacterized protein LOC128252503 n=1 Tax=Drosophila gunungcola TaxID=103775 RepID=UPI0022E7E9BA|nr:uncharacterized protein LOC128252503 [Drosophila gunungcola]
MIFRLFFVRFKNFTNPSCVVDPSDSVDPVAHVAVLVDPVAPAGLAVAPVAPAADPADLVADPAVLAAEAVDHVALAAVLVGLFAADVGAKQQVL